MGKTIKVWLSFALRLGLSAGMLWWLFKNIDYRQMAEAVKNADPGYLGAAGAVFVVINALVLWRWSILMKAVGLKAKRLSVIRWFFIGLFCNLFLPTSVGGDVIKGLGLSKEIGPKTKIFASIVVDRLTGFSGIVIVACVSFFLGRAFIQDVSILAAIAVMTGVSLVLGVVLFSNRIFTFACRAFAFWPKARQSLMNMHQDILLLRGKQKKAFVAVGLSVLTQLILAFGFYLTAKGMHQDIPLFYFVVFSPIVCVATSLPSIGGLGVREIGWVYLLSKVGVPQGTALGLSLINFSFMVILGLLGGLLYVLTLSSGRVQYCSSDAGAHPGIARG